MCFTIVEKEGGFIKILYGGFKTFQISMILSFTRLFPSIFLPYQALVQGLADELHVSGFIMNSKRIIERRNYIRLRVREGVVAVPRSHSAKIGRILDISGKGLSVLYLGKKGWLNDTYQIDILVVDADDYLSKLPVKIVSDNELTNKNSTNGKKERRCGLQFRNLSGQQLFKIEQFIFKFAVGKVWGNHAL